MADDPNPLASQIEALEQAPDRKQLLALLVRYVAPEGLRAAGIPKGFLRHRVEHPRPRWTTEASAALERVRVETIAKLQKQLEDEGDGRWFRKEERGRG